MMKQKYGFVFALMLMLHLFLYEWKAWIPLLLPEGNRSLQWVQG